MRTIRPILLVAFLLVAWPILALARETGPGYYEVSGARRFKVTHTTDVQIPSGVAILRVYHGIPDPAAWSGGGYRAEHAVLKPYGGQIHDEPGRGASWLWEIASPATSSQLFESRYELASADRRLRTEKLSLRWSDFLTPAGSLASLTGVATLAAETKEETPLDSIVSLSHWIHRFSVYDGSASHRAEQVDQTLLMARGHCGHHAALFGAVMKVWGIPCRTVSGFRLNASSELWTENNDWNRHVWVEVMLPGVGWVEVEPRTAGDPFFLPAQLIKNSGMQSQASWVYKGGQWTVLESYQDRIVAK